MEKHIAYGYERMSQTMYIDADACPVKSTCMEVASYYGFQTIFVCSTASHFKLQSKHVKTVMVDQGFQSVDIYIVNHVRVNDIVYTDDYGLASMILSRGGLVLSSRGHQYSENNIDFLLMTRYVNHKVREAGMRTTGPKSFSDQDTERFKASLKKLIEKEGDC